MKHTKTIVISLLVIAILALGATFALAQDVDTPAPPAYGPGGAWQGDGTWGPGSMMGRRGQFGGMMGGRGNFGGGMMSGVSLIDIVSQELGISVDEVLAELNTGISIADLAANYEVDVQVIVDAFSAAHQAYLDDAVANGWFTQEQADWMQQNMASMIELHISQSWGTGFGPGRGPGGFGGCHGGYGPGQWSQPNVAPQGTGA